MTIIVLFILFVHGPDRKAGMYAVDGFPEQRGDGQNGDFIEAFGRGQRDGVGDDNLFDGRGGDPFDGGTRQYRVGGTRINFPGPFFE